MVNALDKTQINIQSSKLNNTQEVTKLVKYVNNEALEYPPDTFSSTLKSGVGSAAVFEGLPFIRFLFKNKKAYGSSLMKNTYMKQVKEMNQKALHNLKKGNGKLFDRIVDFIKSNNEAKNIYVDARGVAVKEAKKIKLDNKLAKLKQKAGNVQTKKIKKLDGKIAKLTDRIADAKASVGSQNVIKVVDDIKLGTIGKILNKITFGGYGKATVGLHNAMKKIAGSKLGNFMKSSGTGIQIIFSGVAEACMEVIPTFKELGKEKGMKQIGKSTVKVLGDTVGFVAGEQIGLAIGTAICPGIGTVVGGVIGFVGGMIGSFVMGKVTKKLVGKSERELAAEEATQKQVQEAFNNKAKLQELKNKVATKIEEEYNTTGELSDDSKLALEALGQLNSNPFNVVV